MFAVAYFREITEFIINRVKHCNNLGGRVWKSWNMFTIFILLQIFHHCALRFCPTYLFVRILYLSSDGYGYISDIAQIHCIFMGGGTWNTCTQNSERKKLELEQWEIKEKRSDQCWSGLSLSTATLHSIFQLVAHAHLVSFERLP